MLAPSLASPLRSGSSTDILRDFRRLVGVAGEAAYAETATIGDGQNLISLSIIVPPLAKFARIFAPQFSAVEIPEFISAKGLAGGGAMRIMRFPG